MEKGKEKQKRKEKRRRPRSPGLLGFAAQPAQTTDRPSPSPLPSTSHAREVAGRPQLVWPAQLAAQRVAHACTPCCIARCHCPLDPTRQPFSYSSSPCHALTAHADLLRRSGPDSGGRSGPGDHARGMALSPLAPRPCNHAWPLDEMHASDPPQSPAAERRAPWPSSAIKALAPEP